MKVLSDIVFIVQARLGSQRVPKKMIRSFNGTTLLDITLDKLINSSVIPREQIYCSVHEKELIDIVTVWAGLEGYAAHLIIQNSSKEEIESLNKFCQYSKDNVLSDLDNYSNDNIKFHEHIMKLTKVRLMGEILESQLIHLQYLRKKFIIESNRSIQSIDEHNDIIKSLVAGQQAKAEKLLKNHALTLVDKIQENIKS